MFKMDLASYLEECILQERIEWAWLQEIWGRDNWMTGFDGGEYDRHAVAAVEKALRT
jgi:hypothetical protein